MIHPSLKCFYCDSRSSHSRVGVVNNCPINESRALIQTKNTITGSWSKAMIPLMLIIIVQEFACLGLRDATEFSLAHFARNHNFLLRQSSSGRRKSGHCPMRVGHRKTTITCNQQPIAADVPAIILGIKMLRPGGTEILPFSSNVRFRMLLRQQESTSRQRQSAVDSSPRAIKCESGLQCSRV